MDRLGFRSTEHPLCLGGKTGLAKRELSPPLFPDLPGGFEFAISGLPNRPMPIFTTDIQERGDHCPRWYPALHWSYPWKSKHRIIIAWSTYIRITWRQSTKKIEYLHYRLKFEKKTWWTRENSRRAIRRGRGRGNAVKSLNLETHKPFFIFNLLFY